MTRQLRKTIFTGLILLLAVISLSITSFAATKTFKSVKKAKYGDKTYSIQTVKVPSEWDNTLIDQYNLICKTGGKTKVIAKNIMGNNLYSNGTTLCYSTFSDAKVYAVTLKSGKKKLLCNLGKRGPFAFFMNSCNEYIYVKNQKWNCVINTKTGKAKYLAGSVASAYPVVVYENNVYDIGNAKTIVGEQTLNRYTLSGKKLGKVKGNFCDIKIYKKNLYVTKYKSSGNTNKYRVFKTDQTLGKFTPVTGWVKKVPKKYRSPETLF